MSKHLACPLPNAPWLLQEVVPLWISSRQRSGAQQLSRWLWLSHCKGGLEWALFAAIFAAPAAAQPNVQHQPPESYPRFGLGLGCTTSVCFWVLPVVAEHRRTAKDVLAMDFGKIDIVCKLDRIYQTRRLFFMSQGLCCPWHLFCGQIAGISSVSHIFLSRMSF